MTLTYRYFTVKKWAILIVTIVLSIRLGHWSDGMDAVKRLGGHVRTKMFVCVRYRYRSGGSFLQNYAERRS